jgi:hypothetical protein
LASEQFAKLWQSWLLLNPSPNKFPFLPPVQLHRIRPMRGICTAKPRDHTILRVS